MSLAGRIFNSLEGRWQLNRIIDDTACFSGEAIFTRINPQCLKYHESGELVLNRESFASYRSFIYQLENNIIKILYDDPGRKNENLHELIFTNDKAHHVHVCGKDKYDLSFDYRAEEIVMEYNITGPQKNYKMKTRLTYIDGARGT